MSGTASAPRVEGVSASVVAAGADRLDFGRVPVTGRPRSRTVTLFNRPDVPASVRARWRSAFSPSERGERAARLTVHADAGSAGEVALSGTGI